MGEATIESGRGSAWKWAVCVLLLFATMLNYMDRMTLNQLATRITGEFELNNTQYGLIESAFAIAFATGAILGGLMVDRWNVWFVYPSAVLVWSIAGCLTGLARDYESLLACRVLLGFAEAVHWPCALRTTQRILSKGERTLGNSILQSGAAVGAVLTPLVIIVLLNYYNDWRPSFVAIGALGAFWIVAWFLLVRARDLALPKVVPVELNIALPPRDSLLGVFRDRRFWLLILVVLCINCTWHYFRAWLPKFLQENHDYTEQQVQAFSAAYYLSTDVGSLAAGFGSLALVKRGWKVHPSRLMVFGVCALLTSLGLFVNQLSAGWLLLGVLMVIGFGALGLFPNYYSFSQDLTVKHQGKVTGMLGCINWLGMAVLHWQVGSNLDATKSYGMGLALAGIMPLIAFAGLLLFWRDRDDTTWTPSAPSETPPPSEAIRSQSDQKIKRTAV